MNTPSHDLHELIESLSQSEKGYFKKFFNKNISAGKQYLKLFDAIEKYGADDEGKLKKLTGIKHISSAKKYLLENILKCLRVYYNDSTVSSIINEHLKDIEILFKKTLFKQCLKLLLKIKQLAAQYEMYNYQLDLISWERKLYYKMKHSLEQIREKLDELYIDETRISGIINNINDYKHLSDSFYVLMEKEGQIRPKKDQKKIKEMLNTLLLFTENKALTYWAKLYYHQAFNFYAVLAGDYAAALEHSKKIILKMESKPQMLIEYPHSYLSALHHINTCFIHTHKYTELYQCLKKLRAFSEKIRGDKKESVKISVFEGTFKFELDSYIRQGEYEKALSILPAAEKVFAKYGKKISYQNLLYFNLLISETYFGLGDYKKSLSSLQKNLNSNSFGFREDLLRFTRIFNLIIHYELENFEQLPYILKSTYRYFSKKKKINKVETILLNFFRNCTGVETKKEKIDSLIRLKDQLTPLQKDPYESLEFKEFNYIDWLESKIQNRTLAEMMKNKTRKSVLYQDKNLHSGDK
ncbi:MAG: hypothetical protein H0W84_01145 [Bacteroidetes bacterium]|nr:hypothetical protein [Bacteroidota bacterium]